VRNAACAVSVVLLLAASARGEGFVGSSPGQTDGGTPGKSRDKLELPRLTLDVAEGGASFAQGTRYLTLGVGYLANVHVNPREDFYSGMVGVAWYPVGNFGLIVEGVGAGIHQDGADAVGAGMNFLMRWHLLAWDKFTFYVDGGAGFMYADHAVPNQGTRFNFLERVGVGVTYALSAHQFLMAGARAVHLSNAGIDGPTRNPAINLGAEAYVGLMGEF
jgi:hypothetical protein